MLTPFASGPEHGGDESGGASGDGPESGDSGATGGAGTGGSAQWDGTLDLAYVRCPRTTASVEITLDIVIGGETTTASRTMGYTDVYDILPASQRLQGGWVGPCDLVLRHEDGTEEVIYDCTTTSSSDGACTALDPAVSHDGGRIAFSVYRGALERPQMRADPQLVDPQAEGGTQEWVTLPNALLQATESQLYVYDVRRGALTELPHVPGVFDAAPAFLSTGRVAFVSTRSSVSGTRVREPGDAWATRIASSVVPQLHTMDGSGRDVVRVSPQTMTADAYPFQLADGRIAHASWQALGLLPFRYDNGAIGMPGAVRSSVHLYALGPWGTHLAPLFGQHTHISDGVEFEHVGVHRTTQSTDGRIWVTDADGTAGGRIYGFMPPDGPLEGPGTAQVNRSGNVFRPADLMELAPWAGSGSQLASPTPDPPVELPDYDDPLLLRGVVRDPAALPGNELMLSWAKGGCSWVGGRFQEIFGDEEPPFTSGSDAFVSMNILAYAGTDTPGCDAGIYRVRTMPAEHPSALEPMVDSREFHELMPVAVIPYSATFGVDAPDAPPPELAPEAAGSPFGEIAASSMLLRETRSADGHPFGGLVQWARQGTDTIDYEDDEVCGVRILGVQPNLADEQGLRAPAGHRVSVLGEVPVRNGGTDPLDMPDTSFRVRVPADVPMLLQGIDCEGRALSTSQTPISVRPGERLVCAGCHQRSAPGLPFEGVAAARDDYPVPTLGAGTVPLLAGDAAPELRAGSSITYDFERDVLPVFESHCTPCHAGPDPDAGLLLDEPGTDPGSTWWRLVADAQQTYVPPERYAPSPDGAGGGRLRPPQLTRYVRFMNARGSLLYWKAANERTDGRTDDQFDDDAEDGFADVDFGPDHPTSITQAELRLLARWIDTAGGSGEPFRADVTPPTLTAAVRDEGTEAATLIVGTVDVGAGIDPASLRICELAEFGACAQLPGPLAHEAGVAEIPLAATDDDVRLRMSVLDRAGNAAEIVRTLSALRGALGQGAPGGDDDVDVEEDTFDEGESDPDTPAAEGEDGSGCGCRHAPPERAWLPWLLVAVLIRRRVSA